MTTTGLGDGLLVGGMRGMFIRQCYWKKNGKRHAYWALVESYRSERGTRQRVVAWLGKLHEAGRLGVQQAASDSFTATVNSRQLQLFEEEDSAEIEPRWVEVIRAGVRVENCRQFGGPWLAIKLIQCLRLDEFLAQSMPRG